MNTEIKIINESLINYNVEDAVIEKMEADYLPLKVSGVDDNAGFLAVKEARLVVKNTRVKVENRRKELKADALEYGRKVDAEAKRIVGRLEPIETHLQAQEDIVKKEKERIEQARQEFLKQLHDSRAAQLMKSGATFDGLSYVCGSDSVLDKNLNVIDESVYYALLEKAKKAKEEKDAIEAEQARIQKEEQARQEAIRQEQAKRQAELDRKQAEQEARERKIREDQQAIEAEKARIKAEEQRKADEERHRKEMEDAKIKAAEEAKRQSEEEAKRKEAARIEAERLAKIEAERQEALKPDKKKLVEYANKLTSLERPELKNEKAKKLLSEQWASIELIANTIILKSKNL